MTEMLLQIKNLIMKFGGITAVNDLSFDVQQGSITALIGPNGAGKTTVFNMLTGVYRPSSGNIIFAEKSLVGLKPFQITARGISRTFQNIRLFKNLSVFDNVRIACDINYRKSFFRSLISTTAFCRDEAASAERARDLLNIFNLDDRRDELAKNLPYGEQRLLEIARALATGAKILLLDEPAAGMNNQETKMLMANIQKIQRDFNLSILLIEHDMKLVMGISEKIIVLDYGTLIAEGPPQEICKNSRVIEAYLGKGKDKD